MEVLVADEVKALMAEAVFSEADEIQYLRNYTSSCPPQVSHRAGFASVSKTLHVTEDIIRERIMSLTLDNELSIEDKYLNNNYDGVLQMQLMTPPIRLSRPEAALLHLGHSNAELTKDKQVQKTNGSFDKRFNRKLGTDFPDLTNTNGQQLGYMGIRCIRSEAPASVTTTDGRNSAYVNNAALEVSTTDSPEIDSAASSPSSKGNQQNSNKGNSSSELDSGLSFVQDNPVEAEQTVQDLIHLNENAATTISNTEVDPFEQPTRSQENIPESVYEDQSSDYEVIASTRTEEPAKFIEEVSIPVPDSISENVDPETQENVGVLETQDTGGIPDSDIPETGDSTWSPEYNSTEVEANKHTPIITDSDLVQHAEQNIIENTQKDLQKNILENTVNDLPEHIPENTQNENQAMTPKPFQDAKIPENQPGDTTISSGVLATVSFQDDSASVIRANNSETCPEYEEISGKHKQSSNRSDRNGLDDLKSTSSPETRNNNELNEFAINIDSSPEETQEPYQSYSDAITSSDATTVDMSDVDMDARTDDATEDQRNFSTIPTEENSSNFAVPTPPTTARDFVQQHVPVYSDISDSDASNDKLIDVGRELPTSFVGHIEEQHKTAQNNAQDGDLVQFPNRFSLFGTEAIQDTSTNSKVYMIMSNHSSVDISDIDTETDLSGSGGELDEQRMDYSKPMEDSSMVLRDDTHENEATEQIQDDPALSPEEVVQAKAPEKNAETKNNHSASDVLAAECPFPVASEPASSCLAESELPSGNHEKLQISQDTFMSSWDGECFSDYLPSEQALSPTSITENLHSVLGALGPAENLTINSNTTPSQQYGIVNSELSNDPCTPYEKHAASTASSSEAWRSVMETDTVTPSCASPSNEQVPVDLTPKTSSHASVNPNQDYRSTLSSDQAKKMTEERSDATEDTIATQYGIHHRSHTSTDFHFLDDQMPVLTVHATLVSVDDHPGVIDELRIDEIPVLQPETIPDLPPTSRGQNRKPEPLTSEKNLVLKNVFKGPRKGGSLDLNEKEEKGNADEQPETIKLKKPAEPSRRTKRTIKPPARLERQNPVIAKHGISKPATTKPCVIRLLRMSDADIRKNTKRSEHTEKRNASPDTARKKRSERRHSSPSPSGKSQDETPKDTPPNKAGQPSQAKFKEFNIFDIPKPPKKAPHVRPYVYDKELGNRRKSTSATPAKPPSEPSASGSSKMIDNLQRNRVGETATAEDPSGDTKSSCKGDSAERSNRRKYERSKSSTASLPVQSNLQKSRGSASEASIVSEARNGSFQILNDPSERMKNYRIPIAPPEYIRHTSQSWNSPASSRSHTATYTHQPSSTSTPPRRISAELDRLFPGPQQSTLSYGNSSMTNADYSTDQQLSKSYRFYPKDYHILPQPTFSYFSRSYGEPSPATTVPYQEPEPFESIYNYKYPQHDSHNSVMHSLNSYETVKHTERMNPPPSAYTEQQQQQHQEQFCEENLTPLEMIFTDLAVNGITASAVDSEHNNNHTHTQIISQPGHSVNSHSHSHHGMMYANHGAQAVPMHCSTEPPSNKTIMINDETQPVFIEDVASYEELEYEDDEYDNSCGTIRSPSRGRIYKRKRRCF